MRRLNTPLTPESEPEFFAREEHRKAVEALAQHEGESVSDVQPGGAASEADDGRFPDCEISYCDQRSEEWFDIRRGVLTATGMGEWLAEEPQLRLTIPELQALLTEQGVDFKKGLKRDALVDLVTLNIPNVKDLYTYTKTRDDAWNKALDRVLAGISKVQRPPEFEVDPDGPPPRNPCAWAIYNGIIMEPFARGWFEEKTGLRTEQVGFCRHKSGYAGCSPDALVVGENVGVELKCPGPDAQIGRLRNRDKLPDEYKLQIHGSMAVTGADAWWFCSYVPDLPKQMILVERDEFTDRIRDNLAVFAADAKRERQILKEMWDEEFANAKE